MSLVEVRSVTITEKGQIVIPKHIREFEGFRSGSKLAILAFKDHLELRPLEKLSVGLSTALASEKVLANDWLSAGDDEAWKNL